MKFELKNVLALNLLFLTPAILANCQGNNGQQCVLNNENIGENGMDSAERNKENPDQFDNEKMDDIMEHPNEACYNNNDNNEMNENVENEGFGAWDEELDDIDNDLNEEENELNNMNDDENLNEVGDNEIDEANKIEPDMEDVEAMEHEGINIENQEDTPLDKDENNDVNENEDKLQEEENRYEL
ncbi:hypothetical protein BB559_007341 [Furculomyces boomerangus]|uniref:Uncharacterized protein n=2 Tax=Harpellales TaxID=61421 RepID=A0A2T9XXN6_9FUNG|nr:hypothetical protein BB559_007341 [Furculomyces boomerangus]PWA01020.1 hypothetical protein BB558_002908 [Smittium angustum]